MLLIPAAILIVALFTSVTLDATNAFLQQRELAAIADAVANDAIASLDRDALYSDGAVRFDAAAAQQQAERSLAARQSDLVVLDSAEIRTIPGGTIEVELHASMKPFFGRLLHPGEWQLEATARARPESR